jgi:hypothetical protein
MSDERDIHRGHVLWAFLTAPMAGAAVLGMLSAWTPRGDPSLAILVAMGGAIVGYPIAFALGIPAYFLLRRRVRPRLTYPVLVGAIIAAAPFAVSDLAFGSASANPSALFSVVGMAFLSGAVGGLAFWLIAIKTDRNAVRFFGPPREPPADAFD